MLHSSTVEVMCIPCVYHVYVQISRESFRALPSTSQFLVLSQENVFIFLFIYLEFVSMQVCGWESLHVQVSVGACVGVVVVPGG